MAAYLSASDLYLCIGNTEPGPYRCNVYGETGLCLTCCTARDWQRCPGLSSLFSKPSRGHTEAALSGLRVGVPSLSLWLCAPEVASLLGDGKPSVALFPAMGHLVFSPSTEQGQNVCREKGICWPARLPWPHVALWVPFLSVSG